MSPLCLRTLKPQTAVKSHAAVRAVFDYAAVRLEAFDVRLTNPADPRRLRSLGWSPKSTKASTPHPALDWRKTPEFMAELARHDDTVRGLRFIILTVARAGAARQAKWKNIDLERGLWSVPIADLKDSKHRTAPFVVPLSNTAIDLIRTLPKRGAFLFPNAANHPIDDQAIVHAIRRMHRCGDWKDPKTGKPATAHGFRASFRTWAKAKRLDREIADLFSATCFYSSSESRMRVMTTRFSLCGARCSKRGPATALAKAPRSIPLRRGNEAEPDRDIDLMARGPSFERAAWLANMLRMADGRRSPTRLTTISKRCAGHW